MSEKSIIVGMPIDWSETNSSSQTDAGHSDWVLEVCRGEHKLTPAHKEGEDCSRGDTWQYKRGDYRREDPEPRTVVHPGRFIDFDWDAVHPGLGNDKDRHWNSKRRIHQDKSEKVVYEADGKKRV